MSQLLKVYQPEMLLATTVEDKNLAGIPRLRLLPGQKLRTLEGEEEEGDTNLNIQSQSKPREENPVGTIFEVYITEKLKGNPRLLEPGAIYYCAGGYEKLKVHKP
jgi:hypothetical protein